MTGSAGLSLSDVYVKLHRLCSLHTMRFSGCTYCHVGLTAGVHRLGNRVHQVTTDSKVTHLHLALGVDEDVGRLHV